MKKILLVLEDDKSWQMSIKLTVKRAIPDAELLLTDDGQSCLNKLEKMEIPPSICILDINLPGDFSGLDVLEKLRSQAKYQSLPIIMFSTSDNSMDKMRAETLGATDYIVKPPISEMKNVFKKIVAKYAPDDDNHESFPDLSQFF